MADRVTVAEAAAILGVSEDVVRKRLHNRQDTDRTPTGRDRTCSTNC